MKRRSPFALALLATALAMAMVFALGVGAMAMSPKEVLQSLLGQAPSQVKSTVLLQVRLPRVLLAALVGAALGVAGTLMQALFRNPLADPGLVGISAGAALGAVGFIVLGSYVVTGLSTYWLRWAVPVAAFAAAAATTLLVVRLAHHQGRLDVTHLLLCGIAVNALAGAGIGLLTFLATDEQLRMLTFWSLGSLAAATWAGVWALSVALLVTLMLSGRALYGQLDALLLGEAEAGHLGLDVMRLKRRIVLMTAVLAGVAVSMAGIIGFVGLVAPHIARLMVGAGHRRLLPLAAMTGALLLVLADTAARTIAVPAEFPLGVLTGLLGAPFFLWLLKRPRGASA